MVIKNNYNAKNIDPQEDYNIIGKGSHSIDNELKREKEGFIKENMNNPILKKLRGEEKEIDDIIEKDKWDFFR